MNVFIGANFYLCPANNFSMRLFLTIFLSITIFYVAFAQQSANPNQKHKTANAIRIAIPPKIDGVLDDSVWQRIAPITDFRQHKPIFDTTCSFPTEVRIAYDDYAIYIGAIMFDPHPDSIMRQLGLRDSENLNADFFTIEFDTYNNKTDSYSFRVAASGVQVDWRESDETYNAVWDSKVKINAQGWCAELKIPYSAVRFARKDLQTWGMEIQRSIRRYRETDQWALEPLDTDNDLIYWGKLENLRNIEPPIRLSATPYLLAGVEHFPDATQKTDFSSVYGGGLDVKYGINEGFTLDMTLLPDFSQVQSDNKIKNLGAFETIYTENRPFFKEAVDLFMKGDIFYSRRIGRTPALFYSVSDSLHEGEILVKNPIQQQLINATKVSGRNKHGLAIGLLNAVTANTYAVAEDQQGDRRKILTDPMSNFNVFVLDKVLKNNSDLYLINSSLIRNSDYRNSNVTTAGASLNNKKNTYRLNLTAGMSRNVPGGSSEAVFGYKYGVGVMKTKGNFLWTATRFTMDDKFDCNEMGVTKFNDYTINYITVSYNKYQPFWKLRDLYNTLSFDYRTSNTKHKPIAATVELNTHLTTHKYLSIWNTIGNHVIETYDYYEPRVSGFHYMIPTLTYTNTGFSTDYRKKFSMDMILTLYYSSRDRSKGYTLQMQPILRLNTKFTGTYSNEISRSLNDFGFVNYTGGQVIFGRRIVNTITNAFNFNYLFTKDVSLNFSIRHYYSRGEYLQYYSLLSTGYLQTKPEYSIDHNFNFNSFILNCGFTWIFQPGSSLNIVWKDDLTAEDQQINGNYFSHLSDTFGEPQLNSLTVKLLYYFDYLSLKKHKKH